NHAGYFPGAERLALKLVYEKKTGKLLGAQCFGGEGADKRIDTAATALASGMTVQEIAELDLAYAPPFSSANDPINFAAFQASNQLEGSVNIISASELDSLKDFFFLDVRNPDEISRYKVNTNLQIKVDSLRDHINEIPKDRKIVCLCQSGQRSYIASRILVQSGFKDVVNLAGGYWTLSAYRKSVNKEN
ncbi:MAG TPA: rhodanese-like domain-containing protein, partial [Leptospiraceae bacterium]|nr:rhodanese-like domain-containing protein [Leptospiraceae bacterium]